MTEELQALKEAAEKRRATIDPIKWVSRPQLFDLSYLHPDWIEGYASKGMTTDYPSNFYLDKSSPQPNEVPITSGFLQLKSQLLFLQNKFNSIRGGVGGRGIPISPETRTVTDSRGIGGRASHKYRWK